MSFAVNHLVGFGHDAAGVVQARYWRFVANAAPTDYWDLDSASASTSGIFETPDLSGSDIASGLSYSSGISFRTPGGAVDTFGAGYQANIFGGAGRLTTAINPPIGTYLYLDFGTLRQIRSVQWASLSGFSRDSTSLALQYSLDGTAWFAWATLTNSPLTTTPFWRNITQNSTIAATSS